MDKFEKVIFFMAKNKEFIYLDKNNNVINNYSKYNNRNINNIINEYNNCKNKINIDKNALHYYERPSAGIAHCIAKVSTYLRLITKYRGVLIIPDNTNQNVLNLTNNIFNNIIVLKPNTIYTIDRFVFSAYIELMDNPKLMKPDNKYPLIVYNNDIYWFRAYVNKYIDTKLNHLKKHDKVFIGKFEGQGQNGSELTKPRSLLGCVPKTLLNKFEKNGFVNIDPYKYNIQEVIYYLRNAKEIILSCGTCGHLYVPYIKQTSKLYYMINVTYEMGINYGNSNIDYNIQSDTVQRFFPLNTKICYYNYVPHYDARVNKDNSYKGVNMLEFLT